jgi:hypothetical protein
MKHWLRRRRAQHFLCPACGSPFLWAQVSLVRKPGRTPVITAMAGELFCAACNRNTGYCEFLEAQGVFNR